MAAADLTVTAHRSKVVSFSAPYTSMNLGFIYRKPKVNFDTLAFLMPFSIQVWILVLGCLFLTSVALYVFGRFSENKESMENAGSSFYFAVASLFCEVRWLIKNGFSYLDFWCMRSALVIFMYEFNQEKKYNSQFTFDLLSEVIT